MRRRSTEIPLNPNLLLDTLCNALGGVIFIALLVVLIADQAPLSKSGGEAGENGSTETNALVEELKHLPDRDALAQNLRAYTQAVDDYAKTALTPVTPSASQEVLLAGRARLKRLAGAPTRPRPSYTVPAIRKAPNLETAYVVVFKNGKVYSAPLSGGILRQGIPNRPLRVQNLIYIIRGRSVQIATDGDAGENPSAALNKLFSGIRAGASQEIIVPDKTKLFLYVYADSVAAFHIYRKQAMSSMPNVIWFGVPENELPSILLTETKESDGQDLSF